ncbi:hypothetical protein [Oryzomonas rubra]|uniref:Uncharacterized protein n=1 Tax=Oryzomonas rubra TaxID=2509454 RepID=A0A5A9XSW7_9BACT|nr:hypothetical protein [Oryzomonas rubra]KAA0895179.1 hypothetical protein ET418_01270 [Oryzomonas rubra]
MIDRVQSFNPPVFVARVERVSSLDVTEEDGFTCVAGGSNDGWDALYVLDQEFLDLLKKRQPLYVYGTLPGEIQTRKEG